MQPLLHTLTMYPILGPIYQVSHGSLSITPGCICKNDFPLLSRTTEVHDSLVSRSSGGSLPGLWSLRTGCQGTNARAGADSVLRAVSVSSHAQIPLIVCSTQRPDINCITADVHILSVFLYSYSSKPRDEIDPFDPTHV